MESVGEVGAMVSSFASRMDASSFDRKKVQKAKRQWCRAFYVGHLGGS
jgi:hypothetical protein